MQAGTIPNDVWDVRFEGPVPKSTDVVILGGGIIGVSTALFLARAGVAVCLCEKGTIACEQSSRNWGWVRQQGRDPDELPIVSESLSIWDNLSRELGDAIGFNRSGVLYLASSQPELEAFENWISIARDAGLDTRILTAGEVDDMIVDGPRGQWRGGMWTPSDGRAEPLAAVTAIADAATSAGAKMVERCAVRTLDLQAGRILGVVTEKGVIRCSTVVCAGGAWSSLFLGNLGIDFPQLAVRATVARTGPVANFFAGNAASEDLAFRRRSDGGYTVAIGGYHEHFPGRDSLRYVTKFLPLVQHHWKKTRIRVDRGVFSRLSAPRTWSADETSPFERRRVNNPSASPAALKRIRRGLERHLPAIARAGLVETWAGMIDTTPDVVPVIDAVGRIPGLYLASGFSGHGFGIGPGAGRIVADLVQGRDPGHDLTRFRFSRFSDGSRVRLGPAM